jgi:hypothetical protein
LSYEKYKLDWWDIDPDWFTPPVRKVHRVLPQDRIYALATEEVDINCAAAVRPPPGIHDVRA